MLKNRNTIKSFIQYNNDNIAKDNETTKEYETVYFTNKKIRLKRKCVLLFSHEMKRTGAPIVLLDLARLLKKMNYTLILLSLETGDLVDDFIKENIPVIVSKDMKKHQLDKKFDVDRKYCVDDMIPEFNFSVFNTLTLYNYIKKYDDGNNKIFWWIHEGTTIIDIPIINKDFPRKVSNKVIVCCVSEYSRQLMLKNKVKYNIDLLPYYIHKSNNQSHHERITINNDKTKIAMIGSISYRKGQKTLIDAIISSTPQVNDRVDYYFIGTVPKDDEYGERVLNEIKKLEKNNYFIHYIDQLDHDKILQLFDEIDALVVSSYDDPLPVVATECMMSKKIVISSDSTGTASLVKDKESGFIFKTGDFDQLREVLSELILNKNKYVNVGHKSYDIYHNLFTYNIFFKNFKNKVIKKFRNT